MPAARIAQDAVEAVESIASPAARTAQDVIEVLTGLPAYSPTWALASGTALSFPGSDTNSDATLQPFAVSRRNRLSPFFYPSPGSTVVVHVGSSGALNDGGNVGVMAYDASDDHSQASPANSGNYTFTLTSATGRKAYFVYSFLSSSYRAGLTGAMTHDRTIVTVTGGVVSQDTVEVLMQPSGAEAHVSQCCVEVLFTAATTGEGGAPGGGSETHSFGFTA